jgi:hypothetical protein
MDCTDAMSRFARSCPEPPGVVLRDAVDQEADAADARTRSRAGPRIAIVTARRAAELVADDEAGHRPQRLLEVRVAPPVAWMTSCETTLTARRHVPELLAAAVAR